MVEYDNIKFTKGTDIVYIGAFNVEENIINAVRVMTFPTSADTPEGSKILNLNKVEDRFTINGVIVYGKLDDSETETTGLAKKELLKTMFSKGSVVVLTYEDVDYNVAVEKFNIKYKAYDGADSVDGEVVYDIIITCVVGDDIGI